MPRGIRGQQIADGTIEGVDVKDGSLTFADFDQNEINWKEPVANEASLPATNNVVGDARVALAEVTLHLWDGTTWKAFATSSYTSTSFDSDLATKTTDDLAEGTTNKYFHDHTHDDLYYTETEVDTALANKSDITHNHDTDYYTQTQIDTALSNKSDTTHNHDTEYYTRSLVDVALSDKSDIGHDHNGTYFTETEITTNYYDKTATDTLLATKASSSHQHDDRYYTESETDTLISSHSHTTNQIDINTDISNLGAITQNIIPGTTNLYNLGSDTYKFANIYAEEVWVGTSSLYVNGKKVLSDETDTMTLQTDVDQAIALTTTATVAGAGNGNISIQSGNEINMTASGGMEYTVAGVAGKNITFTNSSTNGQILFNALDEIDLTAPTLDLNGNADISGTLNVGSTLNVTGGITGSLSGNASSADKLSTARNISITGDATGGVDFDGSQNVSINVAVLNDSHTHDTRYYTETEADARFINTAGDTMSGNLTISGNLTVNGTTTTLDTQTLLIEDNVITINKNQTGTPATTLVSGIEVERGDLTNYQFIFEELTDTFKIGESGALQAVATREDSPISGGVAVWNNTSHRFDTTTSYTAANSQKLDNLDSTQFLRSDTSDTMSGNLTITGDIITANGLTGAITGAPNATIWTISQQYSTWGMFYTQGSPDTIDFKAGDVVKASIALDNGNITSSGIISGAESYAPKFGGSSSAYFEEDVNYLHYRGTKDFYINNTTPSTYIYSTNTYLGATAGDSIHVRGNALNIGANAAGQGASTGGIRIYNYTGDAGSDGIKFYEGGTLMGEIGTTDTTWLRINNNTAKNIYTPRMIRADGGFQVDSKWVVSADGNTLYENGAAINTKYLGITAKAADSQKLDNLDSTQFLRSDANDTMTASLTVNGYVAVGGSTGWRISKDVTTSALVFDYLG